MPSDIAAIAKTACVGCGRESDKVALKRLQTYSRAFGCLSCYLKYSNCSNCQHEKHASAMRNGISADALSQPIKAGACFCGCNDYHHGLAAEFDRQFDVHTGKTPSLQCQRGCGRYRTRQASGFTPLW